MQFFNSPAGRKFLWIFIACLITIALGAFIITPLYKNDKIKSGNDEIFLSLIQQSSVLQEEFETLQQLNDNYASVLSENNPGAGNSRKLDSLNILINRNEISFSHLLDSMQANGSSNNRNSFDLFNRIIQSYRSAFVQSNSLNTIRNAINNTNTGHHMDSAVLMDMKMKLQSKEIENISLNNELNASQNNADLNSPASFRKFLTESDTMLNNMLESQKERNKNLVSYNDKLERENLNLKNQLEALRTSMAQNKSKPSEKTTEQINAELDFGKVDCYLSRADTRQIISNSKQRKELLENALGILNTLSQSGDANVQQQVKIKMDQLKRIAADNHD